MTSPTAGLLRGNGDMFSDPLDAVLDEMTEFASLPNDVTPGEGFLGWAVPPAEEATVATTSTNGLVSDSTKTTTECDGHGACVTTTTTCHNGACTTESSNAIDPRGVPDLHD
ncbi:Aste57867_21782 [Aphanomyces stellatus]|uniref:Aste57867_21782 protein n=1 Tax=Aphanomyces stellatus TaxID=120398 RepID=A0A485LKI4_9STRA|nr:hypothetical protein As57867_021713 [Aphanomyces stellatus]VFT98451.1 Aste57867_21782 [Aphanomyces stellatus]